MPRSSGHPSLPSRSVQRLPPLATMGIGSVPFAEAVPAVRHVTQAYDVPFCPQLPLVEGDMLAEWLGDDGTPCGWSPDRDRELPRAWRALVAQLRIAPPTHGVVKVQVTGPLTLAASLEHSAGRATNGPEVVALARELAAWLAANVSAQVRELSDLGLRTLVVADEPGLAFLGARPSDASIYDPLRIAGHAWGLHVCGPMPWSLIVAAAPDLISCDIVRYNLDRRALLALPGLMRRGTRLALGVVDSAAPDGAGVASARTLGALRLLARASGRSLEQVASACLLTPTCGTGRLTPSAEHLAAAELTAAALTTRSATSARRPHPLTPPIPANRGPAPPIGAR